MKGRRRRPALAVLVAVVLAGCHGTNLPLGEFQARANAVCTQTAQDVAPLADLRQLEGARLRQTAIRLKDRAQKAQAELKTTIPPRDLTRHYGSMLHHLSDVVEYLEELKDVAGTDDERRPAAIFDNLTESVRKFEKAARKVPLDACAQAAARALPGGGP